MIITRSARSNSTSIVVLDLTSLILTNVQNVLLFIMTQRNAMTLASYSRSEFRALMSINCNLSCNSSMPLRSQAQAHDESEPKFGRDRA